MPGYVLPKQDLEYVPPGTDSSSPEVVGYNPGQPIHFKGDPP